ncbi:Sorting nexin-14 [Aphelenchoides besseyi]|nr:Sorting nexin-14 [Aphelenchoides besseyi]
MNMLPDWLTNQRIGFAASIFLSILLYGYNFFTDLLCLLLIGICTFCFVLNLLNDPQTLSTLQNFVQSLLFDSKTQKSTTNQRHSTTFSDQSASYIQLTPWSGIQLSESLNEALENFASCLINDYVERWYKAEFSADNTFVLETKYQIRFGGATAIRALRDFDFVHLLQTELIPLVLMHVNRTSKYLNNLQLKNTEVLNERHVAKAFSKDLHVALQSEQNQEEYLRRIADLLVGLLMDDSRIGGREMSAESTATGSKLKWPSQTCRYFLRELVLSTILQPTLDFIASPDTINRLLITALEPSNKVAEDKLTEHKVGFLENFNKFCRADAPDSLLVLKLSDLSRDPRLLQSFDAYLRDVNGPSHWLDCFLQAHDVFNRLQKLKDNKCAEFNEVYSDAWQLYSAFIYNSARTRIELFSDGLIESFKRAMDEKSLSELIKSTERVYMDLYQELNYSYVVPFCQSENYLSHLCGKAPTIEELSQMDEEKKKSANEQIAPPSSSLSQFPSRIWSMLRGDYEVEESTDEKNREIPELDDEAKPLDAIDSSFLVLEDATPLDEININTWTIRIEKIEPRRRFRTDKIFYVYVVHVTQKEDESFDPVETACCSISSLPSGLTKKRVGSVCTTEIDVLTETTDHPLNINENDSDYDDEINLVPDEQLEVFEALSQLPHSWSMARTYDEFYAFDSALRNFHGVNSQRFALLPDRRMMCARNRQFLESQRKYMEDFLRKLAKQPLLKNSELLFAFLTNPGEAGFETSFVEYDELTLRKSADRRKSAETEADQYITPFIARLLANTLASDEPQAKQSDDVMSLDSGTFSMFPDNASEFNEEPNLFARVHSSNPHLHDAKDLIDFVREPSTEEVQALKTFEKFRENVSILSVYVLGRCFKLPNLIQQLTLTVASIFDRTLDRVFNRSLKFVTGLLFDENTLLAIVRALHLVVFEEHRENATAIDVERRAAQAERLLNHWLRPRVLDQISEQTTEHVRLGIGDVFRCFQQVHFNRQLAFVLLDVLTAHLVPSNSQETD